MGSNSINAARQAALAKVQSGEWSASQAYQADRSGAFTRGMFEPHEAAAKASGIGQWAGASAVDRQAAASFRPSQGAPSQATMRAQAAGINPYGYNGARNASGGAADSRPNGGWGAAPVATAGKLLPSAVPRPQASPRYGLQSVAPNARSRQDIIQELNRLNDASLEFGGAVAERNMAKIQQLSEELNSFDAAQSSADRTTTDRSLNSQYTYRAPGGGVVDPTLDQRAKFNPNTNATWSAPAGSTSVNGGPLSTPAPRALIPEASAWDKVQNPFNEAYTGRLLAGAKERAARDYQQREVEMRQRLGAMGATAASAPGLEQQLMTEARQGYARDFGDYERSLMNDATQSASNFETQKAGALDAFGMNRGNLSLGFSADARAGARLPGELAAQGLANRGAELGNEASELSNDYTRRTMGDKVAAVSAELYGRNLQNTRAAFELDESRAIAPMRRQQAALELTKLQLAIKQAEDSGNRQLAQDLGTAAGKVASVGGFKWIGAGIGAVAGTLGPQALLGGTGWGASGGMALGEMLDRLFAPQQNTAGKLMTGGNASA